LSTDATDQYHLSGLAADASGMFTDDGFIVQRGSIARLETVPSLAASTTKSRKKLIDEGTLEEHEGQLRFTRDHLYRSPSGASSAVLGRPSNGWLEWKNADGRSLSEVMRVARDSRGAILSEAKRLAVIEKCEELVGDGKIYAESELEQYYATFRERFGPEKLRSLDGEALLTFIHDQGNRDSLVYWLEYKNDEEFETRRLGSIVGGSALKFRVFRRKETGHWQAGSENSKNRPQDISVDRAVEFAREHRDQLLSGVELLENLPDDATDDDYALLQDQMEDLAPDVSRLGWGHKYFSLLFPEKLDDYHSTEWQRFHLLKMQQLPPERGGRYIGAGRFVSAAKEAGLRMNQLTATLNAVQGRLHRYWRVGTQDSATNINHWHMMQERDIIAVGWPKLDDLSWFASKKDSLDRLKKQIAAGYPERTASSIGNSASQLSQFVDGMKEGDIIIAANGATIVGLGRITGQYQYDAGFDFPHQRPVEWLNLDEWRMPVDEGLRSTVREIKKYDENIVEVEMRIQGAPPPIKSESATPAVKRYLRLTGYPGRIQSVLERKGQVILYGPPGTGKTYWAELAVLDLAAVSAFGKKYEDLEEQEQLVVTGHDQQLGTVRLCCFHPAYGYEDFLEGYRPYLVNGQMSFELRDGVFKKLCEDAAQMPERNFYLLVDEINRGDIPRIFGELLTILEKDKRGKRIVLPVSQQVFKVPRNVYLVGTMNTADRSISLLDAALRRRFGFIEMMPDGTVLKNANVGGVPLAAWFNALNERIREHIGRDARNLQIGHSYLLQQGSPVKDIVDLKRLIRDDIIPLLEEYCYEDYGTLAKILGTNLIDTTQQRVRQDVFADGLEEQFVDGLLSSYSEIMNTSEALASDVPPEDHGGDEDDDTAEASE